MKRPDRVGTKYVTIETGCLLGQRIPQLRARLLGLNLWIMDKHSPTEVPEAFGCKYLGNIYDHLSTTGNKVVTQFV